MATTRLVISASPLVKIYLPQWHDRLLENPDLINKVYANDETTFDFDIPRGIRAFRMTFNKPIAVVAGRESEVETLYNWLIGESGMSQHETDCYGVVPFDPQFDMISTLDHMASLEALANGDVKKAMAAKKELDKLQKDTAERIAKLRVDVKKQSEARIKRAMKNVHSNLIKQWQRNEESGMGKYPPSMTEALGRYAMNAEIAKMDERRQRLENMMTPQIPADRPKVKHGT